MSSSVLQGSLSWLCCCCVIRLEKALQEFMTDFASRMKEINSSLSSSTSAEGSSDKTTTLAEQEALCDELVEIVENVDYARGQWGRV